LTDETDIAVIWLKKEDWPRWQKIDPELPAYEQWLGKAVRHIKELTDKRQPFEKVDVDPDAFSLWCKLTERDASMGTALAVYADAILALKALRRRYWP
jgi:hypothetical protein